MIIFFRMNAQSTFFQLPKVKKCCLGGSKWRSGSCVPGDKKAQNRSSVTLHAVSHSMPQRLQNVTKNKGGTVQNFKWPLCFTATRIISSRLHNMQRAEL